MFVARGAMTPACTMTLDPAQKIDLNYLFVTFSTHTTLFVRKLRYVSS